MFYSSKLKVFCIGVALLLLSPMGAFAADVVIVYSFPFEFTTYVGITPETIVSRAAEKWTISSEGREASDLIKLLNGGRALNLSQEEGFNEGNVRALVLAGDERYLIDIEGVVLKGSASTKIDKEQFNKFRDSLSKNQRKILNESGLTLMDQLKNMKQESNK